VRGHAPAPKHSRGFHARVQKFTQPTFPSALQICVFCAICGSFSSPVSVCEAPLFYRCLGYAPDSWMLESKFIIRNT